MWILKLSLLLTLTATTVFDLKDVSIDGSYDGEEMAA